MALNKQQIENLLNTLSSKGSREVLPSLPLSGPQESVKKLQDITRQSSNAAMRLQSVGADISDVEDSRNPLEKALNLTPEQFWLLDILEVINRPQQAIFGGLIEGMQEGKLWSSAGAERGFKGEELYYGGELLRTALNIEDKEGVDWTDFAGFALDAFLDPADLALAFVTGGTSIAVQAGAEVVDTAGDVAKAAKLTKKAAKVAKAVDTADAAADAARMINAGGSALDAGADAVKVAKAGRTLKPGPLGGLASDIVFGKGNRLYIPKDAKEYIKLLTDRKFRQSMNIQKVSVTSALFKTGTAGTRGAFAFTDSVIESTMGKLDVDVLANYKAFKNTFSASMRDVAGKVKRAGSAAEQRAREGLMTFANRLQLFDDDMIKIADGYTIEKFFRDSQNYHEYARIPTKKLKKGGFISYITTQKSPAIVNSEGALNKLNQWFGEDVIKAHTEIYEAGGRSFIIFDEKFWKPDNKALQNILSKETFTPKLLKAEEVKDYEIALKNKDPKSFTEYQRLKSIEEAGAINGAFPEGSLQGRVEKQFQQRYAKSPQSMPTSPSEIAKQKRLIAEQIKKEAFLNESGSEAFLRKKVGKEDLSRYLLSEQDVVSKVERLNEADRVAYEAALKQDLANIDDIISSNFPSKAKELSGAELGAYNKKRNAFAKELRKDPSNFKLSQEILENGLANPTPVAGKKVAKTLAEPSTTVDAIASRKQAQFDILSKKNVQGISNPDSLSTLEEVVKGDFKGANDFSKADARKAIKDGNLKVYAVESITKDGVEITTSKELAKRKAANINGKLYTKTVNSKDVAFIDGLNGYLAKLPEDIAKLGDDAGLAQGLRIAGEEASVFSGLSEPVQSSFAPQPKLFDEVINDDFINIDKFYTDEQIAAFELMSKDPRIVKGAQRFAEEIEWIQEYIGKMEYNDARSLIDASMEGYATHTLTEDARTLVENIRKELRLAGIESAGFLPGNITELSKRGYNMSALEANELRKVYNQYLFDNDMWFQKNIPDELRPMVEEFFKTDMLSTSSRESIIGLMTDKFRAINKNNSVVDMLAGMSFGDPSGPNAAVKAIKKGSKAPAGFVTMTAGDKSRLKRVFTQVKQFSKDSYYLDGMLKVLDGSKDVVVEKHMYNLLGLADQSAEAGWKALDQLNSLFKALKTANPVGFNARNFIGNNFNMWASGMSIPEVIRYWNRSMDSFSKYFKGDNAIQKIVAEKGVDALTPQQLKIHETMTALMQNGYFDMDQLYKLSDLEEFRKIKNLADAGRRGGPLNNIFLEMNMKMNLWTDNRARTALYMYALDNPAYARNLGIEGASKADSAMKAVRMVLFDPNDLSLWEEKWMKRLIPFYTFTRQNLAFQMTNLSKNSEKYYRLYKVMNSLYASQDIDVREMNQFEREQFYVPFIGQKDGKYISIKTGIPFNDLIELGQDPLRRVVSAITPAVRAPFELLTGTSTFTGRPIESYEGEMSKNIPFLSKKAEWAIGQLGADVPTRTAAGVVDVLGNIARGESPEASQVARATGLVYEGDVNRTQLAKQYEKLNTLTDKIRALKASGVEVPTIDEIARARSGVYDKNAARMARLQQIMDVMGNKKR